VSDPRAFLDELRAVGLEVESVWDLVKMRRSYPAAVPVLLEWLERIETEGGYAPRARFREGLVRALTVKEARGVAGPAMIREFHRPGMNDYYRWAAANALSVVAGPEDFEAVAEIACDRDHGSWRAPAVEALARTGDPRAVDLLLELLEDETVETNAVRALGALRARQARPAIEPFLEHRDAWVRNEAKKAIAKMDRA
jgi:HEAT repeat protein